MLVLFDYHNYPPVRTVVDFAKPKSGAPRPDLKLTPSNREFCFEFFNFVVKISAYIVSAFCFCLNNVKKNCYVG